MNLTVQMFRHVSVHRVLEFVAVCMVKGIIPTVLNVTEVKAGSKLEATSGILKVFAVSDVIFLKLLYLHFKKLTYPVLTPSTNIS